MTSVVVAQAAAIALSALATSFVGLRAYSRFSIIKRPYVDDYFIIIAVTMSWILTAFVIAQAQFGLGKHVYELPPDDLKKVVLYMWTSILAYNLGLTFTKLSALFQCLRFCTTSATRTTAWVLVAIVSAYGTAAPIASICSCLPVAYFWDRSIKNGKCINLLSFWYFVAIFNIVTDIAVVAMPILLLKDLHLPRRQKWALIGTFAFGGLTCVIAIFRMNSIFILTRSKDVTYDNVKAAIWSSAELNVAITCACLPSLKPLVQKVAPNWLSQCSSTQDTGSSFASRLKPVTLTSIVAVSASDSNDKSNTNLQSLGSA